MALGILEENWGHTGGGQACTKHTNAAPVRFRRGYTFSRSIHLPRCVESFGYDRSC